MIEPVWVTEARKHIGTKEIPGAAHENKILQWWKAIKRGGIKDDETPWCFTGDVEIMAASGWVRFDCLDPAEPVFQADDNGGLSLCTGMLVVKDYSGDVFDINHRSISLTCDVGHRWWGSWGKNPQSRFDTLASITVDGLGIPTVESVAVGASLNTNQLYLLAAFLSDGKYRYSNGKANAKGRPWSIEFEVSKARKIEALRYLGPDAEYTQSKVYGPLTKVPLTVFRFKYPVWFSDCLVDYKCLSPTFINSLSAQQARLFLSAYAKFDGNDDSNKTQLYTSSVALRDNLVTIAVLAGYHPSVQRRIPSHSSLGGVDSWVVAFSPQKKTRHLAPRHITRRHFEGVLYCTQVPKGRIVVRRAGRAPVVTGNCAAFVGGCLEAAGVASSRNEGARSYLTWGVKAPQLQYGSIVVFSRTGGGGHVGFLVGINSNNKLMVLGGNQGNAVSVAPIDIIRLIDSRWPSAVPVPAQEPLPYFASNDTVSTNEA